MDLLGKVFDPDPPRREEAQWRLRSANADDVCDTLSLLMLPYAEVHTGGEWAWLGMECLRLCGDPRPAVRAMAARCLGQLCFSHPELGRGPARAALERLRSDADPDVAYDAAQALDDLRLAPQIERG